SAVRLGRTVSSISLSRKAASYRPRPRLRSQTTISIEGAQTQGDRIIVLSGEGVQDWPRYIAQKSDALLTCASSIDPAAIAIKQFHLRRLCINPHVPMLGCCKIRRRSGNQLPTRPPGMD